MGMPVGLKIEAAGFPAIVRKQNGLGTRIPLDALWTYVHHCQALISKGIYSPGSLDVVAAAEAPIALEAIRRGVSSRMVFDDRELLLRLLDLLQKDHYFERDTDGSYAFRFPLVRRWWRFDRSLVPAKP